MAPHIPTGLLADSGSLPGTALDTLGNVLTGYQGQDAVHLAAVAVMSTMTLKPNQRIGLVSKDGLVVSAKVPEFIGIVDPFLEEDVKPGQWFWMLLFPRTITSLRHVWEHPAFPAQITPPPVDPGKAKNDAEAAIRDLLATTDVDYHQFMGKVEQHGGVFRDDYITWYGQDAHGEIPEGVWDHVEVVLGFPIKNRPKYFNCSC